MKIPQKPIIFAGMALTVIVIAALCVFFALQVMKESEAPEKGQFIGYVNEYTALEKIGDNTYRATISSLPALTPDWRLRGHAWPSTAGPQNRMKPWQKRRHLRKKRHR